MSFSRWQKLSDRITAKVVPSAAVAGPVAREAGRDADGAVAVDFFFSSVQANGIALPMVGSVALLPVADGTVVGAWLIANLHDFHARRWDLVQIAEALDSRR